MHTHITASTDWPCVLNHKLVINFHGNLDSKMWDLAMTNAGVQPVGRGEEVRAGLGETGQTGMEDQLCDPNPRWRDPRWPSARCPVPCPTVAKRGSGSCGSAGKDVMATESQVFAGPRFLHPTQGVLRHEHRAFLSLLCEHM